MNLGKLTFDEFDSASPLVAPMVKHMIEKAGLKDVRVSANDPDLADTAAYCEHYDVGMEISANCVIVEAKRADRVWYAACMILATNQVDVNGSVRKYLGARKTSFAPMDKAVAMSGMEYGGITPIGLPDDWPILIDSRVAAAERVIIGSGIRGSKLFVPSVVLSELPNAIVIDIAKSS